MKYFSSSSNEIIVSFSDIWLICKKNSKLILICGFICAFIAMFICLLQPVLYTAHGTFENIKEQKGELGEGWFSLISLVSDHNKDRNAIRLMLSRKLVSPVVKNLNLQAHISTSYFNYCKENLLKNLGIKPKTAPPKPFICTDLNYNEEKSLALKILFNDENSFDVYGENKKIIGSGVFNKPFYAQNFNFILSKQNDDFVFKGSRFTLVLSPLEETTDNIINQLQIDSSKEFASVLDISFSAQDNFIAADVINHLMWEYQSYVKRELQDLTDRQLAYLYLRKEKSITTLKKLIDESASYMKTTSQATGFMGVENEVEFLATSQAELRKQSLVLSLEINRLQNPEIDQSILRNQYFDLGDSNIINTILMKSHELKQKQSAIELALSNLPESSKSSKNNNDAKKQLLELNNIKQKITSIENLIKKLKESSSVTTFQKLLNDSSSYIPLWLTKINFLQGLPVDQEEFFNNQKTYIIAFLNNQNRLNNMRLKILEGRVSYNNNQFPEFEGITLETAEELFMRFSTDLDQIQANLQQLTAVLKQFSNPNFEISSLSSILKDDATQQLIIQAEKLALQSRETDSRSEKELERLNRALSLNKDFFKAHVEQTISLIQLHEKLIKEKLRSLQEVSLDLIQQQLSMHQQQLLEYIHTRKNNLLQEQDILSQEMDQICKTVANLPQKWLAEQQLKFQVELETKLFEKLAQLVESKNIAHNLEKAFSKPIDLATPPKRPNPNYLLLFLILGSTIGVISSTAVLVVRSFVKGLSATPNNLQFYNQHVAGILNACYFPSSLNSLNSQGLSSLRDISMYFREEFSPKSFLFIEENSYNYVSCFASLLSKQQLKTILLKFTPSSDNTSPGLLHYLQNQNVPLNIRHTNDYDFIQLEEPTMFLTELLSTQKFKDLLENLHKDYDAIVFAINTDPINMSAKTLANIADCTALFLKAEIYLKSLEFYLNLTQEEQNPKKVSFVFLQDPAEQLDYIAYYKDLFHKTVIWSKTTAKTKIIPYCKKATAATIHTTKTTIIPSCKRGIKKLITLLKDIVRRHKT